MAELCVIGEILSGIGFTEKTLFCRYSIAAGPNWNFISGNPEGQTAADTPLYGDTATWAHPLDLHFTSKGVQGWPKIHLQVHCLDSFGRSWLVGYSSSTIPCVPGRHNLQLKCWVPTPTTLRDKLVHYFIGGAYQLSQPDSLSSVKDRYKLKTHSTGKVLMNIEIILRNFHKFGVEYK